jgi:hypothetical protein
MLTDKQIQEMVANTIKRTLLEDSQKIQEGWWDNFTQSRQNAKNDDRMQKTLDNIYSRLKQAIQQYQKLNVEGIYAVNDSNNPSKPARKPRPQQQPQAGQQTNTQPQGGSKPQQPNGTQPQQGGASPWTASSTANAPVNYGDGEATPNKRKAATKSAATKPASKPAPKTTPKPASNKRKAAAPEPAPKPAGKRKTASAA